ncbi:LysR family transcriptional regulator [Hydrogenophaga intermedia]|jgi:LysR family transcriptional regulator, glycine cleavage system transcriptional activator|uniref:LysR family transcriptional regulator n=1 Tax=Hydrogenophaga intermedia TaxID=65786 RepID=UPI002043F14C|nr:LysR family transcriptional regulator [Hydrogenophaga intermedia]MCM3563401.1 LysR substrate-binding domain-containing protein [Hydrogenophaga intermedia]
MSQPTTPAAAQFPLHELLAFEAAARHGSFQKAADELSVTQSAVSHRVINLERRLGVSLFARKGRGIALTEEGATYLDGVSAALTSLWAAGEELRLAEHSLIRVNFAPSIGNVWLLPHLPEFMRNHPSIQIEVASIATPEEVNRADWDVLVHYGMGVGDDARRALLLTDEVLVVGRPDILSETGQELRVEDVGSLTVLRHTLLNWLDWSAGAFGKKTEPARYMHFDDSITMLESAVSGAGIAVTTRIAATPYLKEGALVQIHPFVLKDNEYYVELSESGELKPAAKAFTDWIVRLAAADRTAAS